ncbi:MAG: DUF5979 domain-containing protein [Anaerovoracaceae bacterium]
MTVDLKWFGANAGDIPKLDYNLSNNVSLSFKVDGETRIYKISDMNLEVLKNEEKLQTIKIKDFPITDPVTGDYMNYGVLNQDMRIAGDNVIHLDVDGTKVVPYRQNTYRQNTFIVNGIDRLELHYSKIPVINGFKTINGREVKDEKFNFVIEKVNEKFESIGGETRIVQNDGTGKIEFDPIIGKNLNEGATTTYYYKIYEPKADGYKVNNKVYHVTYNITRSAGTGSDSFQHTCTYSITGGDPVAVNGAIFDNIKEEPVNPPPVIVDQTGSLTISKQVNGTAADKDKDFEFKVNIGTITAANPSYTYTGSKSGTIRSGEIIKLKHGESITISGIKVGTNYQVIEVRANQDGFKTTSIGDVGNIIQGNMTAAFVNTNTGDDEGTPQEKPDKPDNPQDKPEDPEGKPESKPENNNNDGTAQGNKDETPQTGDDMNLALWMMLLVASGGVGTFALRKKAK